MLSIKVAADATVGGPQAIQELDVQNGELKCSLEVDDAPPQLCGDVNDDGAVDSRDALLILQFVAGLISSVPDISDLNGDGAIDPVDAALILQVDAGLVVKIPTPAPAGNSPEVASFNCA